MPVVAAINSTIVAAVAGLPQSRAPRRQVIPSAKGL